MTATINTTIVIHDLILDKLEEIVMVFQNMHMHVPSLFGKNRFLFNEEKDVHCYEMLNYYENLRMEIDRRLNPKPGMQRCVFVYFEDQIALKAFYHCDRLRKRECRL